MEYRKRAKPTLSFVWGLAVSLIAGALGALIGLLIPIPFLSLLIGIALYFAFLRGKVHLAYFIIGYFFVTIVLVIILGAALLPTIIGGQLI